jgi:hypothetical protein
MSIEQNTKEQKKLVAEIAKEMDQRETASVILAEEEEEEEAAPKTALRNGKKSFADSGISGSDT